MERTIHFGIEDVFDVQAKAQYSDNLIVVPGFGRGTDENGLAPPFQDKMKQFDLLIQEKIPVDLGNGKAEVMSFGDLKCRYGGHRFSCGTDSSRGLYLFIGPTSWHEWKQDYNRSDEQAEALQNLGLREHQDRGHYLSNGLGTVAITLTQEGDAVVGVRKSDSYDGAIHGAAGWMTFNRDVKKINHFDDAYRELGEELAVQPKDVSALYLIGLVAYPKTLEADFVFLAKTDKEKEYFTSGAWKEAVDAKEHRDLVILGHPDKINRLLGEGKVVPKGDKRYEVLASTAYGLEMLARHWEKLR